MRSVPRNPDPGERPSAEDALPESFTAGEEQPAALLPLLRALAADARPAELSGFEEPLASFRATFPGTRPARTTWRPSMLSTLLGAKLGATVAGVAVALGGTAVAAYTGVLPTGAQNAAHTTIGAPAATPKPTGTAKPSTTHEGVGPDATGPAAFGLCNAWSHHQGKTKEAGDDPGEKAGEKAGDEAGDSVAFRNLAKAAGGEGKISAYCGKVPHPGNGKGNGKGKDKKATHPTGKPTSSPTSTAK